MSVLLIDIGNSRIKWARLRGERPGRQRAMAHRGWRDADFERQLFSERPKRVVVVSVSEVEERLARACRRATGVPPELVRSARTLGGVTTRYRDPWRLGADRLVACVAGAHIARGRPVCVIDVGTAMTLDFVDARAVHLGGVIVPGPALMVSSLLNGTSGIGRRATEAPRWRRGWHARGTREAIEAGAVRACAATIDRALADFAAGAHAKPAAFLTGGGAAAVQPLLQATGVKRHDDLVLRGLAYLAAGT